MQSTPPVEIVEYVDVGSIPMSYPYKKDCLYVRECYTRFYDYILKTFESTDIELITLTGTPGIGKSIFYLYFFHRFRRENPEKTIVVASFYKSRQLKQCFYTCPGKSQLVSSDKIPEIDSALYLYDGAPFGEPPCGKMVAFASPHYDWIDAIQKNQYHTTMYLPFWNLEELLDANEVLNIGLDSSTIRRRYNYFGGVARYCLHPDEEYVTESLANLDINLGKIESCDQLMLLLKDKKQNANISHRLFHMIPTVKENPPYARFFTYTLASRYVTDIIAETIEKNDKALRLSLLTWLKNSPSAKSFVGKLFEAHCIREMSGGFSRSMRSLGPERSELKLTLPPGSFIPTAFNATAVDGFYDGGSSFDFFQMTVSDSHPVKATGLRDILQERGQLDSLRNLTIRLIFVVPESQASFTKQRITTPDLTSGTKANVTQVPGISCTRAAALARENVYDVDGLKRKRDGTNEAGGNSVPSRRLRGMSDLDKFMWNMATQNELELLSQIQQYVLVMPGSEW